jgi:probable rRNA maturation factor
VRRKERGARARGARRAKNALRKRAAIVVQNAAPGEVVPADLRIRRWTSAALGAANGELTVRIVTAEESGELNARYRGQSGATNVLSFPAGEALELPKGELEPLGDLVVCAEVVAREAREQHKTLDAHWAHMLVHGALHLRGYDHVTEKEARRMATRERELLAELGFPDPYAEPARAASGTRFACKARSRPAR